MPGKLVRLPGHKGLYYRRKDGKYKYKGKRYSKYSPWRDAKIRGRKSVTKKMTKKRAQHYRKYYPHGGDRQTRRKSKDYGLLGFF